MGSMRQWGLLFWLIACAALLTGWNKDHPLSSLSWIGFAAALATITLLNYSPALWLSWPKLFALPRRRAATSKD